MGFLNSIFLFVILSIIFNQFVLHDHHHHQHTVVAATNVLNPGDELKSRNMSSTLISANGKFTLGFFTIPSTNFTYLGIWYTETHRGMKAWVANRDTPMIGYGVLTIDDSGTLKIVNMSGTSFFSVPVPNDRVVGSAGNKTRAVLLDSGNFLVYSELENRTIWQSFDHPTDSLLPGMKIGYNLTTKQNWTLTSWLSDQVPTTGAFTMRLEQYQNTSQMVVYRRGEVYWASGPWDKDTEEFQYPSSTYFQSPVTFQHNESLISDASGSYFTTVVSSSTTVQISPNGQIIEFIDGVYHFNITPEFCYGYEYHGCVASTTALPICRSESDNFDLKSGDWIGMSSNYENYSNIISLIDCMERCWNDCNCSGFTTTNSNGTGCRAWGGDQPFRLDETAQTTQKYVLVSQKPSHKPRKRKTWIWLLVSLASVVTSVLLTGFSYVVIRRRVVQGTKSSSNRDELDNKEIKDAPEGNKFSFRDILVATDNFSEENKLGQGGYGPVYKGKLADGREIAIKRLSKTSGQGTKEFNSELMLISKLQHRNLVRLYGSCIHREEKMLIYEFMPNKSLDYFLFAEDRKEKIDWRIRFNIIEGIAQGLLYLHKYSRMTVIHRDLKASNILLDGNMNPKIADFGLARIFQEDVSKALTKKVVGTYGYIAPEYAMRGTFSIKSDVFSFGVLTLEIVSGKKNSSFYNCDGILNLMGYAWELWKKETILQLRDEALGESYDVKQLLRSIHVGLLCVQENANDRPTMSEVITMLNNEVMDLPSPKQPAFFIASNPVETSLANKHIPASVNGLTLTVMGPR